MFKKRVYHGLSRTRLYHTYYMIKERCYRKTHISYPKYGGRGIKMCEEWLNDVSAFINWCMNNGYKDGYTIDRIDVNGDYEPSNLRFATPSQQQRNRRDTRKVFFRGKEYTLADACEKFGVYKPNAYVQYTRCKGDKEIMTKYFESHAL